MESKSSFNKKSYNKILEIKLLFLIILSILSFALSHKSCGYSFLKRNRNNSHSKSVTPIKAEYEPEDLKTFKELRIHVDYTGLTSDHAEAPNLTEKLKNEIIPKTMKVFTELFKVRRIKSFTLNQDMCDDHKIPDGLKNKKIESDLLILATYDKTGEYEKNRAEASAIHCYQDEATKRPIVGVVTFRDSLKIRNEVDVDYMVWLCLHEISHVLLFNDDLYPSFIDKNLNPRLKHDIIHTEYNKFNQRIDYIKTKRVMAVAKKHYRCDSLKGVPLEYNGPQSAVGGHWSRRALNTDYMIGRSHGENLISPITLAFFEDSGWYKSDFSKASLFYWGKNKGCDFFTKNCVKKSVVLTRKKKTFKEILEKHKPKKRERIIKKYRSTTETEGDINFDNISVDSHVIKVTTYYKKEYCEEINQPVCSHHNKFRGFCGAKMFGNKLPARDRHFSEANIGGYDILINRCPIVVENKFNQKFYGGSCQVGSKKDLLDYEKIGQDSGCFLSSLAKGDVDIPPYAEEKTARNLEIFSMTEIKNARAACIEYTCENGEIYLKIEDQKVHCPSNKTVKIPGYSGEVKCANRQVMCHKKYRCKFGCTNVK